MLEHCGEPFEVTCDFCRPPPPPPMIDGRGREVPLYRPSEPFAKMVPPTVEYRQVGHFKYSAGLLLYTFLVLMAGFLMGFAVRFGV